MKYQAAPVLRAAGMSLMLCAPIDVAVHADDDMLNFELEYTGEVWGLASGGNDKGVDYLDNLYAAVEKSWSATGTTIYVSGLYNNGRGFSVDHVGDAQVISNIEAPAQAARAYEVWINQEFGERFSLKAGLLDVNAEFDVLDSSGLFIGSAHGIGTDIAQAGENGPSIFPITALGARFDAKLSDEFTLRAAILDGVPGDPDHPKRTAIKLGNGDGAFIISELEHKTARTKFLAGYWGYTADFTAHDATISGGNDGFYIRGEGQITGADGESGLYVFGRLGFASGDLNPFSSFTSAGLTYKGLLQEDGGDTLGLAFAWAETSGNYKRFNPGVPGREVAIELTYQFTVNEWITVQPDVQFIVNPLEGASDALAFGLRTTFALP